MAAGEVGRSTRSARHPVPGRDPDRRRAHWDEEQFTAVGFPRVFYLRYHGYRAFFPLWALARYRNLKRGNATSVQHGM